MKPLEVAAQFAAFTWYTGRCHSPSPTLQAEARRFAKENWRGFLSVAHEGWGRLLLRIAKARPLPQRQLKTVMQSTKRMAAAV
jgi:hypothetical protein